MVGFKYVTGDDDEVAAFVHCQLAEGSYRVIPGSCPPILGARLQEMASNAKLPITRVKKFHSQGLSSNRGSLGSTKFEKLISHQHLNPGYSLPANE